MELNGINERNGRKRVLSPSGEQRDPAKKLFHLISEGVGQGMTQWQEFDFQPGLGVLISRKERIQAIADSPSYVMSKSLCIKD